MLNWSSFGWAVLSIISGFSSVALFFIVYRTLWETAARNVMWMSIADFFVAITVTITYIRDLLYPNQSPQNGSVYCQMTGFVLSLFVSATVLWYFMLAYNVFLSLRGKGQIDLIKQSRWQHAVVWGYSILAAVFAITFDGFAVVTGQYCWLPGSRDPFRLLTIYIPVCLSLTICLLLLTYVTYLFIIKTRIRTKQQGGVLQPTPSSQFMQSSALVGRLYVFLLLFFFCWIFPLMGRVWDWVVNSNTSPFETLFPGMFASSGLSNLVVWGVTSPALWEAFQTSKYWPKCFPQYHNDMTTEMLSDGSSASRGASRYHAPLSEPLL